MEEINKIVNNHIFIHIPKCAGMTIWNCYKPLSYKKFGFRDQHTTCNQYIEKRGIKVLDRYSAFTIVRNPYDRMVSWFSFGLDKRITCYQNISFRDWVLSGAPHHWGKWDPYSQLSWLTNNGKANGTVVIPSSRIYKFRDIVSKMNNKINASSREKCYRQYYDDRVREKVKEICKADIDYFDFRF